MNSYLLCIHHISISEVDMDILWSVSIHKGREVRKALHTDMMMRLMKWVDCLRHCVENKEIATILLDCAGASVTNECTYPWIITDLYKCSRKPLSQISRGHSFPPNTCFTFKGVSLRIRADVLAKCFRLLWCDFTLLHWNELLCCTKTKNDKTTVVWLYDFRLLKYNAVKTNAY